jgi:cell division protein FtsI (penicillin-binding protein 3)
MFCLSAGAVVLGARAVQLQVVDKDFLNDQADARHVRVATVSAHRGSILDRNGEPLAVSTPVDSVWAEPAILLQRPESLPEIAQAVGVDAGELSAKVSRNADKEFIYLRRRLTPSDARKIDAQNLPGVHLQREYKRYYPASEVTGHLLGFTNIDDAGQEGVELAYDHWLAGLPGSKRVIKDQLGRVVEDIESIRPAVKGRDLAVSIDLRVQYVAYRTLKSAVAQHGAAGASAVVLDIDTGEVLAMVNQPTFNPNDRAQLRAANYRNRAITDIFEPGSAFKPLIIAAALDSGRYLEGSIVDTAPGFVQVGAKLIEDPRNLGEIDLATILAQSSNVGATKIAMSLEPQQLWDVLSRFGLGRPSASGFPGESAGLLSHYVNWRPISQATLAFGYGLSMTAVQLGQAYSVLASGGLHRPVSLIRIDKPPIARRVISTGTAQATLTMLEGVVSQSGTGRRAAVTGYRIGGKTGTARKTGVGGYDENRHTAVFAGIAPLSAPRVAVVVVMDEPAGEEYYGGQVAAPVFADVVAGALRVLAVAPDGYEPSDTVQPLTVAATGR